MLPYICKTVFYGELVSNNTQGRSSRTSSFEERVTVNVVYTARCKSPKQRAKRLMIMRYLSTVLSDEMRLACVMMAESIADLGHIFSLCISVLALVLISVALNGTILSREVALSLRAYSLDKRGEKA